MFKQLKSYYVVVSLPFVMLLLGSAYFSEAIRGTIIRNPHPQINYAIFYIILFGGGLIILSAYRLMHEARTVVEFSEAMHAGTDPATLKIMAESYSGDISYVLQMIATSSGRSISHQEQAALGHELVSARARLLRRNALPQYLTGLLVGMGLLGTFVGLLATLSDISILISSFAELDMATASPLVVFRVMIERMKAPMQSMSIAFSASMFGLLGSIILGLMMLGIRRMQGDISSLLGSEVARHIEIALSYESNTPGKESGSRTGTGDSYSGDEYKVLVRIEERLAESLRIQQNVLSSEVDDFNKQRMDMLRALTEQTEASTGFRNELQQLGRQFASVISLMEKNSGEVTTRFSELSVHNTGYARESQKLIALQLDEQRKLRETIDSFNIEERLSESSRVQQRALSSEIDDFQKQRADMLRTLAEQTESSNNFRYELQNLGRQLDTIFSSIEKGNSEMSSQISELLVHMAADAKESHKLLAMQIKEQKELKEALDWRSNN